MKQILFTIIYPFWFFFAKTWLGNIMMIPISLTPIPILINVIFPTLIKTTNPEAETIGIGIAILSLLFSPFIACFFMIISNTMEEYYEIFNYKTEIQK